MRFVEQIHSIRYVPTEQYFEEKFGQESALSEISDEDHLSGGHCVEGKPNPAPS